MVPDWSMTLESIEGKAGEPRCDTASITSGARSTDRVAQSPDTRYRCFEPRACGGELLDILGLGRGAFA